MKKKVIIITSVVIFIILIILIIKKNNYEKSLDPSLADKDEMPDYLIEEVENSIGKIQEVTNFSDIITISTCIRHFYENYFAESKTEETKEKAYNMLSSKYVEAYNISKDTLTSEKEWKDINVEIYNIYYVTDYSNISTYFVNGLIRNNNYETIEFNNIVTLDRNNHSFELMLDDYLRDNEIVVNESEIGKEYTLIDKVEANNYNSYNSSNTTTQDYLKYVFNNVKKAVLYNSEYISSILYSESDLKDLNGLTQFCDSNKKEIILSSFGTYDIEKNEDKTIYNCYSKEDSLCIRLIFDNYSKFEFDIFTI